MLSGGGQGRPFPVAADTHDRMVTCCDRVCSFPLLLWLLKLSTPGAQRDHGCRQKPHDTHLCGAWSLHCNTDTEALGSHRESCRCGQVQEATSYCCSSDVHQGLPEAWPKPQAGLEGVSSTPLTSLTPPPTPIPVAQTFSFFS